MKKLIIAMLAASGAAVVYAQAETGDSERHGGGFRAEIRALIDGDGMSVTDLAGLMQERSQARFEALDADSDGIVTRDEFLAAAGERAEARFERLGPNEDGVVTRSGREGWGGRHHRGGPRGERGAENAEQRAERLSERAAREFTRLDADGDGMISQEEFEAGLQARGERFAERREQRAEQRAERREQRGERQNRRGERHGGIDEEARAIHREMRTLLRGGTTLESFTELAGRHATTRFDALDADGNGELTLEEFTAQVAERAERVFARMDRNEDGLVTADDRRRGGGKHGGPRR